MLSYSKNITEREPSRRPWSIDLETCQIFGKERAALLSPSLAQKSDESAYAFRIFSRPSLTPRVAFRVSTTRGAYFTTIS